MDPSYISISPEELKDNPFKTIGKDWFLLTAGDKDNWNTMTASWGGLGVLWHKHVAFIFVRPSRNTYSFVEKGDTFTISFFTEDYRDALVYCGKNSGRDVNKANETGLTPMACDEKTTTFEEARLVLVCKKMYHQDLEPEHFLDPDIALNYPGDTNYHRMYVGEVINCYVKK